MRAEDTSSAATRVLDEAIRGMSHAERVARAIALTRLAHRFALAQIRQSHPEESERQHRLRLAARTLPAPLMRAAFDWVPRDVDG